MAVTWVQRKLSRSSFRLTLLVVLSAAAAAAQSNSENFNFTLQTSGSGYGYRGSNAGESSSGFLSPIGAPAIGFSFIGISNDPTLTQIQVVLENATTDVIVFVAHNPTLGLDANGQPERTGNATILAGTGAFRYVSGSMQFQFVCTGPGKCDSTTGEAFTFNLTGNGTLNLPISQVPGALNIVPRPPPSAFEGWIDDQIIMMGGRPKDVTNPFGNAVTSQLKAGLTSQGSASSDGSIGIALPWQFFASTYTVGATCTNLPADCWITVPTTSGNIPAFTNTSIEADVDFGTLDSGVYPANIAIAIAPSGGTSGAATVTNVPAMVIITNGDPFLTLSETGIQFQSVAESAGPLPAHAITLASSGDAIAFTAAASTLTGGNWLSVTPSSGSAPSGSTTTVSISANPAGLAAGTYFGRVDIGAPGAVSPVQSVEVELSVAATAGTDPILSTTGLIFVAAQNTNPEPQILTLSTLSTSPIALTVGTETENLATWLSATGSSTTMQSGQPITAQVSVNTNGLTPGFYTGAAYAQLTSSGTEYPVTVLLVVTPASGTCTPTQLLPVLTSLSPNFELPAGLPVSVQAAVVDDCGSPLNSGIVQTSFGPGDSPATMQPLGNGRWAGTWNPHAVAGSLVSLTLAAVSAAGLTGSASAAGTLDASPGATVVTPGGIVNAAGLVSGAPVAPGEFLSIFGSNLAPQTAVSSSYPYDISLSGTQVFLNGQALPLQFVSSGQINALVPYGTPVNGVEELLIAQNGVYGLPETVVVAAANPAVFTQSQSGQGAGAIIVVRADGTEFVASSTQPASAGDVLAIYCSGLGTVSPALPDGAAAPLSSLVQTVNTVTASIGGLPAQVSFAGLAPGFAGLYQVNVTVPAGVTAGASVPVILTAAGFSSAPVTVAIQ